MGRPSASCAWPWPPAAVWRRPPRRCANGWPASPARAPLSIGASAKPWPATSRPSTGRSSGRLRRRMRRSPSSCFGASSIWPMGCWPAAPMAAAPWPTYSGPPVPTWGPWRPPPGPTRSASPTSCLSCWRPTTTASSMGSSPPWPRPWGNRAWPGSKRWSCSRACLMASG